MSSTRNSRNLLVNVFRPSYSYGSLTGFTPALSLSNIDTVTATSVVTSNLNVGDASQNLFLGSNAGNLIGNNSGDTAVGYNAAGGISNVQNSVAVGKNAMAGVTDSSGVISIGVDTIGGGTQSIYIGSGTRGSGSKNIVLGADISLGSVSNRLVIGNLLQGDQSNRSLDVSASQTVVWGKMGIQRVPQRSFEVLGDTYSTDGFVTGSGSVSRPAYRFELDNSTGLYWPGSNKFAIATAGIQRMVFSDASTTIVGDLQVTGRFSAGSGGGGGGGGIVGGIIDVSGMTFSQFIRDNSENPVLYDISEGNIMYSGRISNTTWNTDNLIGGVQLSNRFVRADGGGPSLPSYSFIDDPSSGMFWNGNVVLTQAGNPTLETGYSTTTISNDGGLACQFAGNAIYLNGLGTSGIYPHYSFYGDQTTGLYHGSSYNVGITTNGTPRMHFDSAGNIGVATQTPYTRFQINDKISDDGSRVYDSNAAMVVQPTATSTTALNDPTPVLYLGRQGTSSQAYGSMATFKLCRWENSGVNSRTRMDVTLTNAAFDDVNVMSVRSDGRVGIGTTTPSNTLQVNGTTQSSNFITSTASSNTIGGITLSNNRVFSGDGTSGNPAIVSIYDATTGINFTAVGMGISTFGSTSMFFSSNYISMSNSGNITCLFSNSQVQAVSSGFQSNPAYSFYSDNSSGLYSIGTSLIGLVTAGIERVRVNATGNVGIATRAPAYTLDVSGTSQTCNAIVTGYMRNALTPTQFDISGGNISNSGTHLTSNLISGGYLRNALTPTQFDISGGNLTLTNNLTAGSATITGSLSAGSFSLTTLTATNVLASGYLRNALTPTQFDISGGNISNSATTQSSNFIGTTAASNSIGGVTLSNGNIRVDISDTFMVATGSGTNTLARSTDGVTWTGSGASVITSYANAVAWNGSLWVALGNGTNTIATSTDGASWTGRGTSIFSTSGNAVAWNGSLWVAVGSGTNTIATSTDGVSWTGRGTSIFSSYGAGVAWNGSLWVAVGAGTNTIATSTDGINWTGLGTSIFTTNGNSIAWNGRLWVATGVGTNTIATSTDGITWTGRGTSTFSSTGAGVAWNGSLWVAVGSGTNTIASSTDGITWTGQGTSIFTSYAQGVAWNGSVWVAMGTGTNSIATSTDGTSWTGRGTSVFSSSGIGAASRRYILPLIDSAQNLLSNATVKITGSLIVSNAATSNIVGGVTLSNSRVGVGVTNPSTALAVVGDVSASGILTAGVKITVSSIAANQTLTRGDLNTYFLYTTSSAYDINLPVASTAGNGWNAVVRNMPASTANLTVKNSGGTTVSTVAPGVSITVLCDGANMYAV